MVPDYRVKRLAMLCEQTADRPAHTRFLEETLRIYAAGTADTEFPSKDSQVGVSARILEAIEHDVECAYSNTSDFGQYRACRASSARVARRRAETMERRTGSLDALLPQKDVH